MNEPEAETAEEKANGDEEFGEEKRDVLDEEEDDDDEKDELQYKRINTMHAELYVPLDAKSGDILVIEHDGNKQIKVPKGQQGRNITVRMVSNKKEEETATGAFCGCL